MCHIPVEIIRGMEDSIMSIAYTRNGDYYVPNLIVPESKYEIGKYGRRRKQFLKTNRKCQYSILLMSGKLLEHLHKIDEQAQTILKQFINSAEQNAPDKATHQMEWVGYMNNAKASAEEVINQELIYV
jgi:hypothetical protein